MKDTVLKLQIESMEQQLKMLKTKIIKPKPRKKLSEIYGIFKGKMDLNILATAIIALYIGII